MLPARKYPVLPKRPQVFPNSEMPCSAIRGFRPPRFALPAAPPIWMAKPISQYASRPQPYTKKFIMYVWFAFFTRVSPDSHHGEARLHEHDEEAADEGPD